jgi:primosomal protein N' (replication factor Y)
LDSAIVSDWFLIGYPHIQRHYGNVAMATPRQRSLFSVEPAPWELDASEDRRVARVVFSEGLADALDYAIPESLREHVQVGRRLRVPLGRSNRGVVGYCVAVFESELDRRKEDSQQSTRRFRLKDVLSVVDKAPLISPTMVRLAEWMSDFYLCTWGQALETVVPAGVREMAGTREVLFLHVPTHVAARLTQLRLPAKQSAALQCLAASAQPLTARELAAAVGCTTAPINQLRKKGLVTETVRRVASEIDQGEPPPRESPHALNPSQQDALDQIVSAMEAKQSATVLIRGVTGSGKTEIYMRAIDETIHYGRQAIVLVPEISLTPQTCQRFRARFDDVAVLHSHMTAPERHWHWRRIARGEVQVVVGARSAIFAPVPHLGMIVLDEEHDSSFKQDISPRYHARDIAQYRARAEKIPLVLGSATPSLESWLRAKSGRYVLAELPHRVLDRPLPQVAVIDMREEFRSRAVHGAISKPLEEAIQTALDADGKVILLLNRRGFSTHIQCPACGFVLRCQNCDIALTHHRERNRAVCHYCDYERPAPPTCPDCRFEGIRYGGLGTQKLESEVQARFPGYPCLRMDSDTMQKTGSHEAALTQFRDGDVRILVGTQMIAKGLDFPDVTLVGVLNADSALNFPDFRAAERTFQLVTQVAGRTGRGDKGGRVLVQAFDPDHPAIRAAAEHDFVGFAESELPVRHDHQYPPSFALMRLVVRGECETAASQTAELLGTLLKEALPDDDPDTRLLGPAPAPLSKLRGKFRFHLLLFGRDRRVLRKGLRDLGEKMAKQTPEGVQWIIDIDPNDLL